MIFQSSSFFPEGKKTITSDELSQYKLLVFFPSGKKDED
jgi:hypothetical protein